MHKEGHATHQLLRRHSSYIATVIWIGVFVYGFLIPAGHNLAIVLLQAYEA